MDFSAEDRVFLIRAACATIRHRLQGGDTSPRIEAPSPAVLQPAGCFVSLHAAQTHALRGCIGRIDAAAPLLEALQSSAWSVLDDPRFGHHRVTLRELPELTVEVSVLGPLRPAAGPLGFEPLTDGIYLTFGSRAGVFLPQVARETGWGREQLLDRLCAEKLGVPPRTWQDPRAKLEVFPTVNVGPLPFTFAPP